MAETSANPMNSRSFGLSPVRAASRLAATIRNALEFSQLGTMPSSAPTPYEVVAAEPVYRLRRYRVGGGDRPPMVLVPPLMLTAEVYDIAADGSAVGYLGVSGVDPWVVDFGAPEREVGGLKRTLADHVVAVADAVRRIYEITGRAVHLGGYSQGGMFCYQAAAYRRSENIASLVTFGSPVDLRRGLPPGLPEGLIDTIGAGMEWVAKRFASAGGVPAWLSRIGFRMLSPLKELQQQVEFLVRLYDREAMRRREAQRRFLGSEGWVAFPGPALRDFIAEFVVHNRLLSGGLVIDDRPVTLADITCPVLAFVGEVDEIARPATVRSIRRAAPRAEVYELAMSAGHFGLVVGSKAMTIAWPAVAEWTAWCEGRGPLPTAARAMRERKPKSEGDGPTAAGADEPATGERRNADVLTIAGDAATLVENSFATLGRSIVSGVERRVAPLWRVAQSGLPQVSRIARLERLRRDTQLSVGLVLTEQAKRAPHDTFFLFAGRAYSYAQADRRVDAVTRGLVSLGVRQGDHVGIFMPTRPSALAAATALSRLGAVVVMLRPDGDLEREVALAEVGPVITDPENAARAHAVLGRNVWVLGGGGEPRKLPRGQLDMEAIDADAITLPGWYDPNPGRAEDLAFILFAGRAEQVRANRITNRRWALSAFTAAAATAITSGDTVYCCTPLHHPTGILVCVGGALVGGARLAVAAEWSAPTFWDEVRRYGATVVFYTGTMCRQLVNAPFDPAERHHSVRVFAGSGMTRGLWLRVRRRFSVNVLEFYAATEGNAVLANLSGEKVGSVGKAFAGSSPIAIASYDLERRSLVREESGFGRRARPGEAGLLLVGVDRELGAVASRPLRGVFSRGDAWHATRDLFRHDADGDYWLVDHLDDVIRTAHGAVASIAIEDAVGGLDFVDLAVAYGVAARRGGGEIPVLAVTVVPGRDLDLEALSARLDELPSESRPAIVRVLDEVPLTAGYRPRKEPLRADGMAPRASTFVRESDADPFRPLDATALERLVASAALPRAAKRRRAPVSR
jgi:putative long chain acyl-CoA synthase